MSSTIVNSDNIIGVEVRNNQDEKLGKIEALMLDKLSGKVSYVVLSYGGILGMGDKLFAMPWSIFNYDTDADCFRISVESEKLENSPGFDKDHWPNMSDTSWKQSIHDFYGTNAPNKEYL